MVEVLTVGAYGWGEAAFFSALQRENVAVFCDIRRRRGVRGPEYAFVNSGRLQERLSEVGIGYVHRLELAPSQQLRQAQAADDRRTGTARRTRSQLDPAFAKAYADECLAGFDSAQFLAELAPGPVVLFCVEREPQACHRSVVADRLASDGAPVRHLRATRGTRHY